MTSVLIKKEWLAPLSAIKKSDLACCRLEVTPLSDYSINSSSPSIGLLNTASRLGANQVLGVLGNILGFYNTIRGPLARELDYTRAFAELRDEVAARNPGTRYERTDNMSVLWDVVNVFQEDGHEDGVHKKYVDFYRRQIFNKIGGQVLITVNATRLCDPSLKLGHEQLLCWFGDVKPKDKVLMTPADTKKRSLMLRGLFTNESTIKAIEESLRKKEKTNEEFAKSIRRYYLNENSDKMSWSYAGIGRREYVKKDGSSMVYFIQGHHALIDLIISQARKNGSAYVGTTKSPALVTASPCSFSSKWSALHTISQSSLNNMEMYGHGVIKSGGADPAILSVDDLRKKALRIWKNSALLRKNKTRIEGRDNRYEWGDPLKEVANMASTNLVPTLNDVDTLLTQPLNDEVVRMEKRFAVLASDFNHIGNVRTQKDVSVDSAMVPTRNLLLNIIAAATPLKYACKVIIGEDWHSMVFMPVCDEDSMHLWVKHITLESHHEERYLTLKQGKVNTKSKEVLPLDHGNFYLTGEAGGKIMCYPHDITMRAAFLLGHISRNVVNSHGLGDNMKRFLDRNPVLNFNLVLRSLSSSFSAHSLSLNQMVTAMMQKSFFEPLVLSFHRAVEFRVNSIEGASQKQKNALIGAYWREFMAMLRTGNTSVVSNVIDIYPNIGKPMEKYLHYIFTNHKNMDERTYKGLSAYAQAVSNAIYSRFMNSEPKPKKINRPGRDGVVRLQFSDGDMKRLNGVYSDAIYRCKDTKSPSALFSLHTRLGNLPRIAMDGDMDHAWKEVSTNKVDLSEAKLLVSAFLGTRKAAEPAQ